MSLISLLLLSVFLLDESSAMPFFLSAPSTRSPRQASEGPAVAGIYLTTDRTSVASTSTPIHILHQAITNRTFSSNVDNTTPVVAQPTYVPGNMNKPTQVQTASMVIGALGLPMAGVMLYLAWATFLRDRGTGSQRRNSESGIGEQDPAAPGEEDPGVDIEMANMDVDGAQERFELE